MSHQARWFAACLERTDAWECFCERCPTLEETRLAMADHWGVESMLVQKAILQLLHTHVKEWTDFSARIAPSW